MEDEFIDQLFESQSDLSSVNSENELADAYTRLGIYEPDDNDDRAKRVLSAFLEYLPDGGKLFIARIILLCDDQRLRDLCRHLETAILLPSKIKLFL